MINAMVTSNPTQRIYPQRIYPPDPSIKTERSNYDPVLGLCNSTQRIYPPDRPEKPGGLITTPFLNYIIISQQSTRSANKCEKQLCRNLWGHGGVQTLDANFDKSFVTPVYAGEEEEE